jgi:hypothetical protein
LTLIAALFLLTDLTAAVAVRYLDPRVEDQGIEIDKT